MLEERLKEYTGLVNNKLDRNNASDEVVIDVVSKQVKTHRESIEEFKKGNRLDLVENLTREIELLSKYLPEQLTQEQIELLVKEAIENTGATTPRDIGKVMQYLRPKTAGKADGKLISDIVKNSLNNI